MTLYLSGRTMFTYKAVRVYSTRCESCYPACNSSILTNVNIRAEQENMQILPSIRKHLGTTLHRPANYTCIIVPPPYPLLETQFITKPIWYNGNRRIFNVKVGLCSLTFHHIIYAPFLSEYYCCNVIQNAKADYLVICVINRNNHCISFDELWPVSTENPMPPHV